jgi:ABC-type dipeptide/oligopeptide/nickel transport system permease subunit
MQQNIRRSKKKLKLNEEKQYTPRNKSRIILLKFKKNKMAIIGLAIISILIFTGIFANFIAPQSYREQNLSLKNQSPSTDFWFGTDEFGRCIFSRIVYGARISLKVGIISTGISVLIGIIIGSISAYYGGFLDQILVVVMDVMWAFPTILLSLIIVAIIGASLNSVIIAIALSYWVQYARLIRGQILSLKNELYIEVIRSLGANDSTILWKHLLPNAIIPVVVAATLGMGSAIVLEATLSFLGMGAQPPTPSWGSMLSNGRTYLFIAPWSAIIPGIATIITVLGFNLLGDGLRDIMDIKMKE